MKCSVRSAALFAALLLAWPATAHASRIVVLNFQGSGPTAEARLSLVRPLLEIEGLTLVPQGDYVDQVTAAGVGRNEMATPTGVRMGAAVAAVDAVMAGRTVRKGNRWHLRLTYYDAEGNQRVRRDYLLVRGEFRPNDLDRIVRFVRQQAQASSPALASERTDRADQPRESTSSRASEPEPLAMAHFRPPETPASDPNRPDEQRRDSHQRDSWDPGRGSDARDSGRRPDARDSGRRPDTREPGRRPDASDTGRREGRSRGSEFGGPDWSRSDAHVPGELAGTRPLASVLIMAGGGNRRYDMVGPNTSVSYATAKPASGVGFALFPEVGAIAQSFPLKDDGGLLGGLGAEVGFARGFVASFVQMGADWQEVKTPITRFHIDGRFRVSLLPSSPFSPEVGARAGFGLSDFRPNLSTAAFTEVSNRSVRAGLEVAQPIIPNWVRLEAWIVTFLISSAGEPEKRAFGLDADAGGWAGRVGLSGGMGRAGAGPAWMAWLERQVNETQFVGGGSRDPGGGDSYEAYFALHAGVGWAF